MPFAVDAVNQRFHIIAGFLLAVALLLGPARAKAQPIEPTPTPVLVSPLVYVPEAPPGESAGSLEAALVGGVVEFLVDHEDWRAVTPAELIEAVEARPGYAQTVDVSLSLAEQGVEQYKQLQVGGAIESLEKATRYLREARYDLVDPELFAEIASYLALSYLEQRAGVLRPIERFQQMLLLDPSRIIRRGFYPDPVVDVFEQARAELRAELRQKPASVEEAAELAALAGAEYVAYLAALPGPPAETERWDVVLHLFSAAESRFLTPESIEVRALEPAVLREAANRLMSRHAACLQEGSAMAGTGAPTRVVRSRGESPWGIHLSFAHGAFLERPGPEDLRPFNLLGASVGADFALTREFSLMAMVQIFTNLRDYSGRVKDDFTTFRSFFGAELGVNLGALRLAIAPLLEISTLGDIHIDESEVLAPAAYCDQFDCAEPTRYEYPLLMGVNARPRISYRLLSSLELSAAAGVSFFFYPLSRRELNFPVTYELGVLYRF